MIKNEFVTLDGENYGITVESVGKKTKFVSFKDDTVRIFKNLDIAKIITKDIVCSNKARYYFYLDGKTVPLDNCIYYNGKYQYIDREENIRYIIQEFKEFKTLSVGYLCFEDGDTVRCEKKYGIKRQKELMNIVSDICTDILCKNDDITIDKIVKKSSKELILRLKGSSGRIHILSNSHLMDINQERKEEGNRAFPFVKQMDKFTTLYVFITKDKSEPFRINTDDNINILLNCIVESLQVNIPETNPKYIPVEYNGYINLMED